MSSNTATSKAKGGAFANDLSLALTITVLSGVPELRNGLLQLVSELPAGREVAPPLWPTPGFAVHQKPLPLLCGSESTRTAITTTGTALIVDGAPAWQWNVVLWAWQWQSSAGTAVSASVSKQTANTTAAGGTAPPPLVPALAVTISGLSSADAEATIPLAPFLAQLVGAVADLRRRGGAPSSGEGLSFDAA